MELARDLITLIAVAAGAVFFVAGTTGLLRFPDPLTRLHALTKADNLGVGLIVLGLAVQAGGIGDVLKLLLIWVLVLLASGSASQMIGAVARRDESGS
jgi:multicomponent Na+:H+ antiporter subunit G